MEPFARSRLTPSFCFGARFVWDVLPLTKVVQTVGVLVCQDRTQFSVGSIFSREILAIYLAKRTNQSVSALLSNLSIHVALTAVQPFWKVLAHSLLLPFPFLLLPEHINPS